MAFGAVKGTWTFNAASIVANNQTTLATGSAVVARGDLIVVCISEQTGNTATGASDTLGNTYTALTAGTLGGGISGRGFYTIVTNPGTNTNINVAATASANNVVVIASSYEGSFLSIDSNPANNNNTDNTSPFSGPATGALAQLVENVINWRGQLGSATLTATSPLLKDNQVTSAAVLTIALGHRVVNSTSTSTPEWTGTNPAGSQQGTASFRASPLPNNQYHWPLTPAPKFYNELRFWSQRRQLIPPPANVDQPRTPHHTRPWGRPAFFVDQPYNRVLRSIRPFAQYDWPLAPPRFFGRMWQQALNLALTEQPAEDRPFNQSDWPISLGPVQLDRSYWQTFPPVLIGQDFFPPGTDFTDRPPVPVVEIQTWIQAVNLALNTQAAEKPFAQTDWPTPGGPQQPISILSRGYNPNLIGQDRLPNRQMDWPVPRGPAQPLSIMAWGHNPNLVPLPQPFRQTDWPNPRAALRPSNLSTWLFRAQEIIVGAKPFKQDGWPINRGHRQPDRSYATAFPRVLIGKDRFPPGRTHLDLPPRQPLRPLTILTRSPHLSVIPLIKLPHNQRSWPVPTPHTARPHGFVLRNQFLPEPIPPTPELPNVEGPIIRDWWDRDEWGRFIPGAGIRR